MIYFALLFLFSYSHLTGRFRKFPYETPFVWRCETRGLLNLNLWSRMIKQSLVIEDNKQAGMSKLKIEKLINQSHVFVVQIKIT